MIEPNDVREGRINDQLQTQLESLSAQVEANLEVSRNTLSEWRSHLRDRSARYSRQVDDIVHERPWELAIGGLTVGLALGLLLGRRR